MAPTSKDDREDDLASVATAHIRNVPPADWHSTEQENTGVQYEIEARRNELASLVERYANNHDEYIKPSYGETSLRVEFLDPLFCIFGWDVNNKAGYSIYAREVIHEASVTVDDEDETHANKKPDYAFRIGGETKFFLEAKKPSVNIIERRGPAFQTRRYGWNGNHAVAVLSNFEDLSIYDCGYRPTDDQGPAFARISHYHFDELVDHFEEIYALLSKEAVVAGSLESVDARERAAKVPFDDLFLSQITSWRGDIALDIYSHYEISDQALLNQFTQILLNRIIFLRVCEDRSFEDKEELLRIATYGELRDAFAAADEKYDSGLFNYLDDAPWTVSDYLLINIFQDLYYPESSYDFNVVQPHVIGHIYEQFLSERVCVEDGRVHFESTPEAIESNGAVPTPKDITDAVVANTLSDVSFPCRVADVCCGSGNFLLSAYEYLASKEISRIISEGDTSIGLIEKPSGPDLPYWRKRQILAEAIYGVDVDPLAVEVARLSLALRLLEGCSSEEIEAYRAATGNKLLPDLSNNIKCGNSIVGYAYFDFDSSALNDMDTMRSVRPFDWASEFPFGGFDAIIGNPPYIRVQNLARYTPKEYEYYRSSYCDLKMASAQLLDKYMLFVERALGLLNASGKLGMIVPNKFMTIATGKQLRTLLTGKYHVSRLVDFGTLQVFPGRSTYTCILVATPEDTFEFSRIKVESLADFVASPTSGGVVYPSTDLTAEAWSFPPVALTEHLTRMADRCTKLSDMANVFVGLQTSNDAAYIIDPIDESNDAYTFIDLNGHQSMVEKILCRPCLLDVSFELYGTPTPNRQIIFPYYFVDNRAMLIPIDRLRSEYPNAYAYLVSIKEKLESRAFANRSRGDDWYRFGRSQSLGRFSGKPHLIWPVLSLGAKYVNDQSGKVMFTGGGNGPYYDLELKDNTPEAIEYVQAALSYWLTETLVRSKTSLFRGDYYAHGKQFVAELPIRRINFSNPSDVALYKKVVATVQTLNELVARRASSGNKSDVTLYSRSIAATESNLKSAMDKLYDTTPKLEEEVCS